MSCGQLYRGLSVVDNLLAYHATIVTIECGGCDSYRRGNGDVASVAIQLYSLLLGGAYAGEGVAYECEGAPHSITLVERYNRLENGCLDVGCFYSLEGLVTQLRYHGRGAGDGAEGCTIGKCPVAYGCEIVGE